MHCQSLPLYSQPKKLWKRTVKECLQRLVIPTTIQTTYFMCLGISILCMIILLKSASHIQIITISILTTRRWRFREWYLHQPINLSDKIWILTILWFYKLPTITARLFHRHLSQTRAPQFVGCLICSFTLVPIALLVVKKWGCSCCYCKNDCVERLSLTCVTETMLLVSCGSHSGRGHWVRI